MDNTNSSTNNNIKKLKRRDFLGLTTASIAGIGVASAVWPLIKSLSPSSEVAALATVEVDLSEIKEGKTKVITWQGKPVFIRKRNKKEIKEARSIKLNDLKDPETDEQRTHKDKDEWLVMVGVCTHLGCIPIEKQEGEGWFCPCHGSYYDTAGRIIKGPAPKNLPIPDYYFANQNTIVIGKKGEDNI